MKFQILMKFNKTKKSTIVSNSYFLVNLSHFKQDKK